MTSSLLLRGLLAGLLAGLLTFGFARVAGEPEVDRAIAFESAMSHAGHDDEPEIVSRETQRSLGLFTAVVVYSTALGGLFSLVFAVSMGRVAKPLGPRGLAALLALLGFVAIILVPDLTYPANPPSVGHPDTIRLRTGLFFLMLLVSSASMAAAVHLARSLAERWGRWNAVLGGVAAYLLVMLLAHHLFPAIDEVPSGFSATLLWQFRITSLGLHLVLWTSLGLLFGWLAEQRLLRSPSW